MHGAGLSPLLCADTTPSHAPLLDRPTQLARAANHCYFIGKGRHVHLGDIIRIAKHWLAPALVLAIIAAAAAYLLTEHAIQPSYTATVNMQVELGPGIQSTVVDPTYLAQFAETEAQLAGQYPIVNQSFTAAETSANMQFTLGEAKAIKKSVTCVANSLTSLFSCSVTAHSALFAATMANTLANAFTKSEQRATQTRYAPLLLQLGTEEQAAKSQGNLAQYNALVNFEAQVRESSANQATLVRVVARAIPPVDSSSPHPALNGALAFALIFALVLGVGTLTDQLDDSIRNLDDLKDITGLPTLGIIPALNNLRGKRPSAGSLVVASQPRSPTAEAFRVTRTGITFSRIDNPPSVLLVTSTLEGEGKSTVAANLAVSYAEAGNRVLLVDLDLRRPTVADIFGLPNYGLTNMLMADKDAGAYDMSALVPNLRVLPSGPLPPNPAALITSNQTAVIMKRLRATVDIVILDAPPLLAAADASIASKLADSVILVVRTERVRRRPLQRALETLRASGAPIAGIVANSVARSQTTYYYQYSYNESWTSPEDVPAPSETDQARGA